MLHGEGAKTPSLLRRHSLVEASTHARVVDAPRRLRLPVLSRTIAHREQALDGGVIAELLGLNAFVLWGIIKLTARDVDGGARVEVDESDVLEERLLLSGPDAVRNRQDEPDVGEIVAKTDVVLPRSKEDVLGVWAVHIYVSELPDARRRDAMRGQVPAYSFVGQAVFALMR